VKKRTKIVTTLGPATNNPQALRALFQAGANVVRLNFSHGTAEEHIRVAKLVREVSHDMGIYIGILGDLQGPKIRVARFEQGKIELKKDAEFILDATWEADKGNQEVVGIDYKELVSDCKPGDILLLDDGRVQLEVSEVGKDRIRTKVLIGGPLSNNKGINKLGGGLSAPALTEKDKRDILTAAQIGVDYLAVSFPRTASDMDNARKLQKEAGGTAGMIAKIERAEVVANNEALDAMILASDGVMVARGDLGVEIGDAELIGVQKRIIQRARSLDRVVITATQMMESMIHSPIPTRAEVFDVANAVLDGTDAVMLSAETATGDHPVLVVEAMARACRGAEKERSVQTSGHRMQEKFTKVDEAIAMATMYAANHLTGIKAIACLTESGSSPLWMSRIHSGLPIFALTRRLDTLQKTTLYRGVEGIMFDPTSMDRSNVNALAINELVERGLVKEGDYVILTKGDHMGILGGTNAMKILKVGAVV
jgi:pyruvate kinase